MNIFMLIKENKLEEFKQLLNIIKEEPKIRGLLNASTKRVKWTPLYYAARCGRKEMVKLLLEMNADIYPKTDLADNCLHGTALGINESPKQELLLENFFDIFTKLVKKDIALRKKTGDEIKSLLINDVNKYSETPIDIIEDKPVKKQLGSIVIKILKAEDYKLRTDVPDKPSDKFGKSTALIKLFFNKRRKESSILKVSSDEQKTLLTKKKQ